jgi:putative addiction module killer protein
MIYALNVYQTINDKLPFDEWLEKLDTQTRQRIRLKLGRLSLGNFNNCKSICPGLLELKIDSGPGYRVYFSLIDCDKILILFAGTKRTQQRDIAKAKKFLKDFKTK